MKTNLNCYVVDDENHAVDTLQTYIEKTPGLDFVGSSNNPLDALDKIGKIIKPDITFLDVDMPHLSGIDLAGLINEHTAVIFTTAHRGYAIDAFEKKALDYLLKPISYERFLNSVKKVSTLIQNRQAPQADHMYIKSNIKGKVINVAFADIQYIESIKNYVIIYTRDEKLVTYLTMKELELVLPDNQFFRVHKSFMVNVILIKTVTGSSIQLKSGNQVPLGNMYKNTLLKYINDNLVTTNRQS